MNEHIIPGASFSFLSPEPAEGDSGVSEMTQGNTPSDCF